MPSRSQAAALTVVVLPSTRIPCDSWMCPHKCTSGLGWGGMIKGEKLAAAKVHETLRVNFHTRFSPNLLDCIFQVRASSRLPLLGFIKPTMCRAVRHQDVSVTWYLVQGFIINKKCICVTFSHFSFISLTSTWKALPVLPLRIVHGEPHNLRLISDFW